MAQHCLTKMEQELSIVGLHFKRCFLIYENIEGQNMKIWLMAFSVCSVLGLMACNNNSHDANRDGAAAPTGQNTSQ